VLDASPEVLTIGVCPGDSPRRVEQLCPLAVIPSANEALYQSHRTTVRNILAQFADGVESGDWGELYIELSALARAFPSEEVRAFQLIQQLDQAIPLQPTLGLASSKFTARQAAQQVSAQPGRVLIVPAGGERRFLETLPLKVLPDPPAELLRRLHLFGITTLGGSAQLLHSESNVKWQFKLRNSVSKQENSVGCDL
jgi:DNA polymerase IV